MRKQQSGFTLIELIVVMVIVGLLAAVAVPKFLDVTKKAEAASVKNIIGSLRSALSLQVASGLINGNDIADWAHNGGDDALNPMDDLLADKPESFIGVLPGNAPASEKGKWWDRSSNHWTIYKLKNESLIEASSGYNTAGKNIMHRIETVTDPDTRDLVGLTFTTYPRYKHVWTE